MNVGEHNFPLDYWIRQQHRSAVAATEAFPRYWAGKPETLLTQCNVHSLMLGTGRSIYQSILPVIEAAEHEVLLVTCFWARSETLELLNNSLRKLSAKAKHNGRKITVRIGFSSSSLFQKLFHTPSPEGKTYSSSTWVSKLGLPNPDELTGLDLKVKSIFVRPFSVMHPKFIVVDRKTVLLPSCNISWEEWFEGCVQLSGLIVAEFVRFAIGFWWFDQNLSTANVAVTKGSVRPTDMPSINTTELLASQELTLNVYGVFLPSPHHRNPRFALPWKECPSPPPTPLNSYLMCYFAAAQTSIYMQTPNLTAPPVLSALLAALRRGIFMDIVTSERLMILEQLVTGGTTTSRCVRKLVKRHKRLVGEQLQASSRDVEAGEAAKVGRLRIRYYQPDPTAGKESGEPVQSHLKLTIFDNEEVVLGSGNMDRASWYTSQELGVAFTSKDFAASMKAMLHETLMSRTKLVYDSGEKK